jgi:fucose permease
VATAAILAGSWRTGYLFLAAVDLAAAAAWIVCHRLAPPPPRSRREEAGGGASGGETGSAVAPPEIAGSTAAWSPRRVRAVLTAGLVVFFVYTGLEVSAGQWEASYLRGHLGLSRSTAGLAAFGYWGALTAARIGLALPSRSVPVQRLIFGSVSGSIVATALIWWQPGVVVSVGGFVLLGAALAGMFPALVAVTPLRNGAQRAEHAIAWQLGAAAGGGSGISALIGLLIGAAGLGVLGPALLTLAVLLFVANAGLARLAPIPTGDARAAPG